MHPKDILIEEYDYPLPEERIAKYPAGNRDKSKLAIFSNGSISQDVYQNISNYLPGHSLLVLNDTRVIKARILFPKPSGAIIEIFCLEPFEGINDYAVVLKKNISVKWKCMIGGAGKWKQKLLEKNIAVQGEEIKLTASLIEKLSDAYVVEFVWQPACYSFAEILENAGDTPLPPYLKRKAEETDAARYQTIYSKHEGSVAAPTAGLHFTPEIFEALDKKNIHAAFTTLHVGAGTFKPVTSNSMEGHEMHAEWMEISVSLIQQMRSHIRNGIYCVGTTSVRSIESIYWMGVKALNCPDKKIEELAISQWEVYEDDLAKNNFTAENALDGLLQMLQKNNREKLLIQTQIIIAPGYQFRLTKGLVTNFHQQRSTLLLLVAAMAGKDWKKIYEYALENEFRFLSYGDGCLITIA